MVDVLDKGIVLPPWTAVSGSATAVSVWNRVYDFSDTSILKDVECGGVGILSAPVTLQVDTGSGLTDISFGAPTKNESLSGDGRWVLTRTGSCAGISAALTVTVYYDGLVWFDLQLTQSGVTIENLFLITHFTEDASDFVHYVDAPSTYVSQNNPDITYSNELTAGAGNKLSCDLKTSVWIGNNTHGMTWCIESDECWWTKDRADVIQIDRAGDGTVDFSVEMVSEALHASAPATVSYQFGFIATPVRELSASWRGWTHSTQWDSITGAARGSNLIYWPNEFAYMQLDCNPGRYINVATNQAKIVADRAAGRKIIPYFDRLNIYTSYGGITLPDGAQMVADWACDPTTAGGNLYRLSATSGWADYFYDCIAGFAPKLGHMDGVYYDEIQPVPNKSTATGGGYTDWAGNARHTWEFFGTRRIMEAVAYLNYTRNGAQSRDIAHNSSTNLPHQISSSEIWLQGEQFNIAYFAARPDLKPPSPDPVEQYYYYSYCLPMDRLRAEFCGRQWGAVILWLPALGGQPAGVQESVEATRDMLSRVLQVDVVIWPLWCNTTEVRKTWTWRAAFGIDDPSVEFVPYWENTKISAAVTGGAGDLKVGYYYHADDKKYLVIVSNVARTNCTASLNLKSLCPKAVVDAETETPETIAADHTVALTIDRNDFVVLTVEVDEMYIKKGEVGGNGTELTPWGTGAEFIAGTTNGDLLDAVVNAAGNGAGVLDGQWALGSRINFTLQQWAGQLQSLLDHSGSAANNGTLYKTSGWGGTLTISGLDVVNSATGTAGTAAVYFSGINSALADISLDLDAHNSKRGIYVVTSAGTVTIAGDHYSNTEMGVYTYSPTGGTLNVYGTQRLNGLFGCYFAVLASGVVVNNFGRQHNNTQHGVYLVNCTGGTYTDLGQQDSNTQYGLYDYNRSGGTYTYSGKAFSNGRYGLFLNTLSGSGRRWNVHKAELHSNTWDNLRITTAATDNVQVSSSLIRNAGAGYDGAYFGSTTVGVKFYRNTVAHNPEGYVINDAASQGHQIVGNIFAFNAGVQLSIANGAESGALIAYNCFWAADDVTAIATIDGTSYNRTQGAALLAALEALNPANVGNIVADPRFVDAAGGNYRLLPDSPCLGTGVAIAGVTEDIEGWPIDTTPDMGCYERHRTPLLAIARMSGSSRPTTRFTRSRSGGRGR